MQEIQKQTLARLLPNAPAAPELIVPRSKLPEDLLVELESSPSVKILVAGQRGMGKTTELRRLESLLTSTELLPVFVQFGAQELITHPMLLRAMARTLQERLPERVTPRVAARFQAWFAQEEEVLETEEGTEGSASIGGKAIVVKAQKGMHHKNTKKTTTRLVKSKTLEDLVSLFNDLLKDARKATGARIVFIVDDIDKIQNTSSIESTFVDASQTITAIDAPCIFTVPITYATSSSLRPATLAYGGIYRVPAVEVLAEDGGRNAAGIDHMKTVLQRRMPYSPIPIEVLERLVISSGGVYTDAMRLARALCKQAILRDDFVVDASACDDAFQALVDDYKFVFDSSGLWKTLARMCGATNKSVIMTEEKLADLLYKMIVIEYRETQLWFDVHPAARRLYEQNADVLTALL